jgi:hypothetical protein
MNVANITEIAMSHGLDTGLLMLKPGAPAMVVLAIQFIRDS